jgi:hypothetical protein
MGMGIETVSKINYNNIFPISNEESLNKFTEDHNINLRTNKSIHFEELQNRIKKHRKHSAPEYLFDAKSRKLFYSILFPKEKIEEKNICENDNYKDLNDNIGINFNINNGDDTNKISKKISYDINDRKQSIDDDDIISNNEITNCEKGEDIRNKYICQLINKGVWIPNIPEKKYNSIIIFDWDDTLLPTSFLNSKGTYNAFRQFTKNERKRLLELENLVLQLLTLSVKKGDVYIITNADKKWVENSSKIFYPSISNILKKIKIISAKNKYQKRYPSRIWKIKAFINLANDIDLQKITNIICSGDSAFEIEAARILATKFTEAFIKTIKFKEKPDLEEVYKQIKFVLCQFNKIYSAVKNLSITVEKRK